MVVDVVEVVELVELVVDVELVLDDELVVLLVGGVVPQSKTLAK